MNIKIPYNFDPREYQIPLLREMDNGCKRAFIIFHRRAGKDVLCWNYLIKRAAQEVGVYYYFLPTGTQAKKIIFDGIRNDGFAFIDHIPKGFIGNQNSIELKTKLKNGSIIQLIGTDRYDAIRGTNPKGCVFSEYAFQNPLAWQVIRPILTANGGWAIFNTTPNGKNHAYDLWEYASGSDNWFTQKLTVDDTMIIEKSLLDEEKQDMMPEMFEQEYYCFPSGTDIFCQNKTKDISEIEIGDIVLTHSGRFREVKKLYKRAYNGELVRIKSYGINKDLLLTPNHNIRITKDGKSYEWKKAEDVSIGDRVCFPKTKKGCMKYISEDMAKIIAWFIAEGSVNKQSVIFTLNSNEKEYIKEIIDIVGGVVVDKGSASQVQVNNAELKDFLVEQCGKGAKNKRIPFSLISGNEEIVYDTLVKGDGHTFKEGKNLKTRYSTISKTLAYQVMFLANSIGKASSIREDLCEGESFIMGRKVHINNRYSVNIRELRGRNNGAIRVHKNSVSGYVSSVSKEIFDGNVYNFGVQYDESYVANGRVVHNCSFDVGAVGSYYGDQMKKAREEGRICKLDIIPENPVDIYFDLGRNDATSIWYKQDSGENFNFINYFEDNGKHIDSYFEEVDDYLSRKVLSLGKIFLPHDSKQKRIDAKESVFEIAKKRYSEGKVEFIPQTKSTIDDINTTRKILSRCYFDADACRQGINCLKNYKKKYDEKRKVFLDSPDHDWSSHGSDSFRYFAVSQGVEEKDYFFI